MFQVTYGNSKLGSICAINLPAIVTCREDAPCKKLCYANKGTFRYENVRKCYHENLRCFLEDAKQTEEDIVKQLPVIGFCRVHASGDIVNKEYLQMLVNVANRAKGVKFMCFTKKYEMINEYLDSGNTIPKNLKISAKTNTLSMLNDFSTKNPV
jgi:hypothetical protein